MSIVAVKVKDGKITLGADSILVCGYTQEKREDAKLFKVSDRLMFGAVGMAKDGALLKMFAVSREPKSNSDEDILDFMQEFSEWKKKKGDAGSLGDSLYIIVFNNKAFHFNDYYIREIVDYDAIGAGMTYALAALYLGSDVRKAIETACELNIYCEKPINTLEM